MKKSTLSMLILFGVCVVLGGGYWLITANEDPVTTSGMLYTLDGNEEISRVEIDNEYGSFAFKQQDGEWIVESGGVYHTNPEKIQLLLSCLREFEIDRALPEEKSEYGLEQPRVKVRVTTSSGREHSFDVGAETMSASSVYIRSGGRVLLTSTAMVAQLTGSLTAYRVKDVLTVDAMAIRSIDYYVKGEKTMSVTNTSYLDWSMNAPISVPARKVIMTELVSKLSKLVIAEYPKGELADSETGLGTPDFSLVLTDETGATQTLEFGAVEGTMMYVRIGEKDDIVKLYAADVDFGDMTPESVMYVAPLNVDMAQVAALTVESGGQTDVFSLEHSEEGTIVKLNGSEIPYDSFVSVYYKCIALNADGYDLNGGKGGNVVATCSMTLLDGETMELPLVERDSDTLYLLIDGQTMFYMPKEDLTELLYKMDSLKQS